MISIPLPSLGITASSLYDAYKTCTRGGDIDLTLPLYSRRRTSSSSSSTRKSTSISKGADEPPFYETPPSYCVEISPPTYAHNEEEEEKREERFKVVSLVLVGSAFVCLFFAAGVDVGASVGGLMRLGRCGV